MKFPFVVAIPLSVVENVIFPSVSLFISGMRRRFYPAAIVFSQRLFSLLRWRVSAFALAMLVFLKRGILIYEN